MPPSSPANFGGHVRRQPEVVAGFGNSRGVGRARGTTNRVDPPDLVIPAGRPSQRYDQKAGSARFGNSRGSAEAGVSSKGRVRRIGVMPAGRTAGPAASHILFERIFHSYRGKTNKKRNKTALARARAILKNQNALFPEREACHSGPRGFFFSPPSSPANFGGHVRRQPEVVAGFGNSRGPPRKHNAGIGNSRGPVRGLNAGTRAQRRNW